MDECQICFEPCSMTEQYIGSIESTCECNINMQHFLAHRDCFEQWWMLTNKCPICRTPLLVATRSHELERELQYDAILLNSQTDDIQSEVNAPYSVEQNNNNIQFDEQLLLQEVHNDDVSVTQHDRSLMVAVRELFKCCVVHSRQQ